MRKLIKLLFILPVLLLAACDDGTPKGENGGRMFFYNYEQICAHSGVEGYIYYLRDTDTDIMYVYINGSKRAAISVYYNSEGEPMTYTEFTKVHHH